MYRFIRTLSTSSRTPIPTKTSTKTLTRPTRPPIISVTEHAWEKMASISKHQNNNQFLFSANGGGCNGFNYSLTLLDDDHTTLEEFKHANTITNDTITNDTITNNTITNDTITNDTNDTNEENEKNVDITIVIDPMAEMMIIGTTIDYVSEDYVKGVFENKFVFTPDKNLATSCGCGVSFALK